MARRKPPTEQDPELDMSSMIDVSFLLLIYFIVTSTLDPKEADLGMTLPTSESNAQAEVEIDQMTIEIRNNGEIVVNDEVVEQAPGPEPEPGDSSYQSYSKATRGVPTLFDRLVNYAEAAKLTNSTPMVIVAADDASSSQRMIDVLNALASKKINIKNVTLTGFTEE